MTATPELLERAYHARSLMIQRQSRRMAPYRDDPEAWIHDCVTWEDGEGLSEGQMDALTSLPIEERVCIRAPRGYGKTTPAALATLWYATTREGSDWKVPTTAGSWLQLEKFLWPEIHKWAKRLNWRKIGRDPFNIRTELLTLQLKLGTGAAFAINSDEPDLLEGAHSDHLLGVIDEGKAIPDKSWDAVEGWFASPGEALTIALSIPGPPIGRFFDIHNRKPGYEDWKPVHITVDQALREGRIREKWVLQREKQWGRNSALFKNHVLAEFGGEEDGVIPLADIEAAIDRWKVLRDEHTVDQWSDLPLTRVGVDVADGGADDTVLALRSDNIITELRVSPAGGTMKAASKAKALLERGGVAVVDSIGVGAGTFSRLKEQVGKRAIGYKGSERTDRKDKNGEFGFTNVRSAAYWNLREMLGAPDSDVALPDDPVLLGELTAPTFQEMSGGKIQVEPKERLVARLGHSPDRADAVVMVFWEEVTKQTSGLLDGADMDSLSQSNPWR